MAVKKITPDEKAITSSDIQVQYVKLYEFMMDYLWEFPTVQALADLEIAIYQRFPDKTEMANCLNALNRDICYTYNELAAEDDPGFKDAVERLGQMIEDYEDPGCKLYSVTEVIDSPEDVGASEVIMPEKHKFEIGEITKTTKEERELQEEAMNTLSNPFEEETSEEGEE